MSSVIESKGFCENNVIEIHHIKDIPFNTKACINDGEAVYCVNGTWKRLRKSKEFIINPKKVGFFGKNKKDKTEYTVCFVDTRSLIKGAWGDSLEYDDPKINGIRETIGVRAYFYIRLIDALSVMKSGIITDNLDSYSHQYVKDKVRALVGGIIKSKISAGLNENGIIVFQELASETSEEIRNALNESLMDKGIEISTFRFEYSENEEHARKRNELNWETEKARTLNEIVPRKE